MAEKGANITNLSINDITIYGWMFKLGLDPSQLLVFSFVYANNYQSDYQTIENTLHISHRQLIRIVNYLINNNICYKLNNKSKVYICINNIYIYIGSEKGDKMSYLTHFSQHTRGDKMSYPNIKGYDKMSHLPSNPQYNRGDKMSYPNKKNFIKPTYDEVEAYCKKRKNTVDPHRFIDYYESKGWLVGKTKMKDWKAAVRTWERNSFDNKQKGYENVKAENDWGF